MRTACRRAILSCGAAQTSPHSLLFLLDIAMPRPGTGLGVADRPMRPALFNIKERNFSHEPDSYRRLCGRHGPGVAACRRCMRGPGVRQWQHEPHPPQAEVLCGRGGAGACLINQNGVPALATCSNATNAVSLTSNGQIILGNLCLDVYSTPDRTSLAPCNGSTTQEWIYTPGGHIKNRHTGTCLWDYDFIGDAPPPP
jgi:hypothetical protein